MKNYFVLYLLLLIACSEAPQDVTQVDPERTPADSETAPETVDTVRVKLLSRSVLFDNQVRRATGQLHTLVMPDPEIELITHAGEPTTVYRVRNGLLSTEEVITPEPLYHLVWGHLQGRIVLMNVLENQIPYLAYEAAMDAAYENITPAQEARLAELRAEWKAWAAEQNPEDLDAQKWHLKARSQWHQEINPQPFDISHYTGDFGDEIEVIIKHSFILKPKKIRFVEHKDITMEMVFVDVKRNISRPHITF